MRHIRHLLQIRLRVKKFWFKLADSYSIIRILLPITGFFFFFWIQYEPLGLDEGHSFLEVGLGSGYGAALSREIVGPGGLVVSIEIDSATYEFARTNLDQAGYHDIITVQQDGGLGVPEKGPYDRICLTAACTEVPPPLFQQLKDGGKLIAPILKQGIQNLLLFEKHPDNL